MTDLVIHASSLPGFPDCARRWAARHFFALLADFGFVLRPTPTGAAMPVGTGVHAGACEALTEKMLTGRLAPLSQAEDRAIDALRQEIEEQDIAWDSRDIKDESTAERHVLAMVRVHHKEVAPGIRPASVETRLEATVCEGVILTGQSDVTEVDKTVRDLKTSVKATGAWGPQIGAYARLSRSHGQPIEHAAVDLIRRGNAKRDPESITLKQSVRACEVASQRILEGILSARSRFVDGDPDRHLYPGDPWAFTANPMSMTCGDKYCPAWGTSFCTEHAK